MQIRCSELKKKKTARLKRAQRARVRISMQDRPRLSVYRSLQHIYAQVIEPVGGQILVQASSLDKTLRQALSYGGNVNAAKAVGKLLAERALAKGIEQVAFDRSGYKYHGRVQALADSARECGLNF